MFFIFLFKIKLMRKSSVKCVKKEVAVFAQMHSCSLVSMKVLSLFLLSFHGLLRFIY